MSELDPETRDLLAAIRNALEAGVELHWVLGVLDGLVSGRGQAKYAISLLRAQTAVQREQETTTP